MNAKFEFGQFRCKFYRYMRSAAGNLTLIGTLAAVPVVGSLGLAVDYVRASRAASSIQWSVDGAVLAAASAMNVTGTSAQQATARASIANSYLHFQLDTMKDVTMVGEPAIVVANNTISIDVDAEVKGSFINALNAVRPSASLSSGQAPANSNGQIAASQKAKNAMIHVSAHAAWNAKGAPACITTLDPSASEAFYLNSPSELQASKCNVNVLSTSNTAAKVISASSTTFKKICVAGGAVGTLAGLTANCVSGGDELASYIPAVTVPSRCDATNKTFTNDTITPPADGYVFCGSNTLGGGGVTTLKPGLYIVKNGLLNISSKTVHGDGVTFYFPSSSSDLTYASKEDNYLKAPTSGPYQGLLMFQPSGLATQSITIGSADKSLFEGIIYAPKWNLTMNSTSDWNTVGISRINMVVNTFRGISISKLAIQNYIKSPQGETVRTVMLK